MPENKAISRKVIFMEVSIYQNDLCNILQLVEKLQYVCIENKEETMIPNIKKIISSGIVTAFYHIPTMLELLGKKYYFYGENNCLYNIDYFILKISAPFVYAYDRVNLPVWYDEQLATLTTPHGEFVDITINRENHMEGDSIEGKNVDFYLLRKHWFKYSILNKQDAVKREMYAKLGIYRTTDL